MNHSKSDTFEVEVEDFKIHFKLDKIGEDLSLRAYVFAENEIVKTKTFDIEKENERISFLKTIEKSEEDVIEEKIETMKDLTEKKGGEWLEESMGSKEYLNKLMKNSSSELEEPSYDNNDMKYSIKISLIQKEDRDRSNEIENELHSYLIENTVEREEDSDIRHYALLPKQNAEEGILENIKENEKVFEIENGEIVDIITALRYLQRENIDHISNVEFETKDGEKVMMEEEE